MIHTLFSIDAFITTVKNWKSKKAKFKKLTKNLQYFRRDLTAFETTRFGENNKHLTDIVLKIFEEEFNTFGNECRFKKLKILDSWIIKYKKNDYQIAHHHGRVMYSGILYIDLDKKHETTTFISPFPNEMTGQTKLKNIDCKEGTLIIFPAHLLHFVKPNIINKDRNILSFDLDCYI
jgi:hypothetical protein